MLLTAGVTCAQTLEDYSYSSSTGYSIWKNVTNTTNLLGTGNGDSKVSAVQSIGFSFPFAGSYYTQFSVNSDGNLRLGGTATGTGNYDNPFNSTNANQNGPKINFLGCDGYFLDSIHYVRAQNFVDNTYHNDYLVVEFCLGTYATATRTQKYKWQVQLYKNGRIVVLISSTAPTIAPAVSHQKGLCVNASDGLIVNSNNTISHFSAGSTTSWAAGTWPTNAVYQLINPCGPPPRYDYRI